MIVFESGKKYATIAEISERKDCLIGRERVKVLCAQGRICGAVLVAQKIWLIPFPLKVTSLPNSNKSNRKTKT